MICLSDASVRRRRCAGCRRGLFDRRSQRCLVPREPYAARRPTVEERASSPSKIVDRPLTDWLARAAGGSSPINQTPRWRSSCYVRQLTDVLQSRCLCLPTSNITVSVSDDTIWSRVLSMLVGMACCISSRHVAMGGSCLSPINYVLYPSLPRKNRPNTILTAIILRFAQ